MEKVRNRTQQGSQENKWHQDNKATELKEKKRKNTIGNEQSY